MSASPVLALGNNSIENSTISSPTSMADSIDSTTSQEVPLADWQPLHEPTLISTPLEDGSGQLHSRFGSFDPVWNEFPSSNTSLDFSRPQIDGLWIVQLIRPDARVLEKLCADFGCEVIDYVPDSAWLVRGSSAALEQIEESPAVRWVGGEPASWRLGESLITNWLNLPLSLDLVLQPASDLDEIDIAILLEDLLRLNVGEVSCDVILCRLTELSASNVQGQQAQLSTIAMDGRIIFSEPLLELRTFNAQAAVDIGLTSVITNHNSGLNGSGETIAILDTGLDSDHIDFGNRVLSVRTSFSYDQSGDDTNSGHGTHVAGTLIGDGTGDSSAAGFISGALLHMYALEYDISGSIAKTGSTYDIMRDSRIQGARIGVNAWGTSSDLGQYNLESRSLDVFANDYPDYIPVFAVGEDPMQGSNAVAPPSTAKNVFSFGASDGSAVANFSAHGPVLDGRIKPDLVAPGVNICSTRAEEARYPAGNACASGLHANGDPLYMSISGTSPATAVGAAGAALMRQFLREEAGIVGPSADLVKAALINGAQDLGAADIPNPSEGWGQIDLDRSMYPADGALSTWYDNTKTLDPGYGFLYNYDLDMSQGIDITLVWTDAAGSSTAPQSQSRIVNNLNLQLISPDGTVIYHGNNFVSGASVSGGSADTVNNVERIHIPSGVGTINGQWTVKISHLGGSTQQFAIVVTGNGTSTPGTDLAVISESIWLSQSVPLVNDEISLRLSWVNQAPVSASSYRVLLEDLTTSDVLLNQTKTGGLDGGKIESVSIYHTFTQTGEHHLRLTLDADDDINEINDANSGVDNNIGDLIVNVSAMGLRIIPLMSDGSEPSTPSENSQASLIDFNASAIESIAIPFKLRHEGTLQENVTLSVSSIQEIDPANPFRLLSPEDSWSRSLNVSSTISMPAAGEVGDNELITLTVTDDDSDLSGSQPRFAREGRFVVDITARYQIQPTVSHSLRYTIDVGRVDNVLVVSAGTGNLVAEPGQVAFYSISVMNIGNAVSQYNIACQSTNGWPVEVGPSNSASIEFEPLDILEYLPMQVRLMVPPVVSGSPAAGTTDEVSCTVTSTSDPLFSHVETATITVAELKSFNTQLFDLGGNPIGPQATANPLMVNSGDFSNLSLEISNDGNIAIPLNVKLQAADPTWPMEVSYNGTSHAQTIDITIEAGETANVKLAAGIPMTAPDGAENNFTLTTKLNLQGTNVFITNGSMFKVGKLLALELNQINDENDAVQVVLGGWSNHILNIENIGNAPLSLEWAIAEGPEGWDVGLDSPPLSLEQLGSSSVNVGVFAPNGTEAGMFPETLKIRVNGTYGSEYVEATIDLQLFIKQTAAFTLTTSNTSELQDMVREESSTIEITVHNVGNTIGSGTVFAQIVDGSGNVDSNWVVTSSNDFSDLADGAVTSMDFTIEAKDDAGSGIRYLQLSIVADDASGSEEWVSETLEIGITAETGKQSGGLFGGLPTWAVGIIVGVVTISGILAVLKLRSSVEILNEGETLVAPGVHTSQDNISQRRSEALMEDVHDEKDLVSGEVSYEEIQAALVKSMSDSIAAPNPAELPPPAGLPPLPSALPAGLPPLPGALPKGLPPLPNALPSGLPPLPSSQPVPAPHLASSQAPAPTAAPSSASFTQPNAVPSVGLPNAGPPLPAEGLPVGWTQEQWVHYGAEWLKGRE